jgi:hypothetical protein
MMWSTIGTPVTGFLQSGHGGLPSRRHLALTRERSLTHAVLP